MGVISFCSAEARYVTSPVHCQHSSHFTAVKKPPPPLETLCLLFVEQHLNHTHGGFLLLLSPCDTSAATYSATGKTPPGNINAHSGAICREVLIARYSSNPFSYSAIRNIYTNIYTRSSDSTGVRFLCSQAKTLRVGGLFSVIHVLAL